MLPASVELIEPTTPLGFKLGSKTPPVFLTSLTPLSQSDQFQVGLPSIVPIEIRSLRIIVWSKTS